MKKSKKTWVVIAFILAFIIIFRIVSSFNMPYSWLGVRLYVGDRNITNLHINVDGKPAKVVKADKGLYKLIPQKYGAKIVHKARNYDVYEYRMLINNKYSLKLNYQHFNWWEILRTDIYIDIDTKSDAYKIIEKYKYTAESPVYHIESGTKDTPSNNINYIDYYIGPK